MKPVLVSAVVLSLLSAMQATSQEAVFVIRHGEKETEGRDPSLADAGRARAGAWAKMLSTAKIGHVITTDARRSRETGEIIASTLGVTRSEVALSDVAGLTDLLAFDHEQDRVLVVGHTETIPSLLQRLGHPERVNIDQADFANLFIAIPTGEDDMAITHLRMP